MRCLIVTPDKIARDVIKTGFEQTGKVTVETCDDSWALELLHDQTYGIVVADTELGDGTDGLGLLAAVRERCPDAELLLITRSRNESRYLSRERHTLGIYAFIQVPVEPAEFYKTLSRLFERVGALT